MWCSLHKTKPPEKNTEIAQTYSALEVTSAAETTIGSAQYMKYENDRYAPRAYKSSKRFLFPVEQDNPN